MKAILMPIVSVLVAYLIGSISSAIITCWLFKLPDPRTTGSGNPGATNVLRIGSKLPAIFTLLGDMLKGTLIVWVISQFNVSAMTLGWVSLAVFMGHLFPIYFQFKGGKGVATFLGILLALKWQLWILGLLTWLLAFIVSRISSVGALTIGILVPVYAWFLVETDLIYAIGIMAAALLLRHKDNIYRLSCGLENKSDIFQRGKA